jgi:hypothetical protein
MKNMTLERRAMSDREYLDLLDYALDVLEEFETQVDVCSEALRRRAAVLAS